MCNAHTHTHTHTLTLTHTHTKAHITHAHKSTHNARTYTASRHRYNSTLPCRMAPCCTCAAWSRKESRRRFLGCALSESPQTETAKEGRGEPCPCDWQSGVVVPTYPHSHSLTHTHTHTLPHTHTHTHTPSHTHTHTSTLCVAHTWDWSMSSLNRRALLHTAFMHFVGCCANSNQSANRRSNHVSGNHTTRKERK